MRLISLLIVFLLSCGGRAAEPRLPSCHHTWKVWVDPSLSKQGREAIAVAEQAWRESLHFRECFVPASLPEATVRVRRMSVREDFVFYYHYSRLLCDTDGCVQALWSDTYGEIGVLEPSVDDATYASLYAHELGHMLGIAEHNLDLKQESVMHPYYTDGKRLFPGSTIPFADVSAYYAGR